MNSRMNLVPAFQNNRKWLKAERKKILRKLQTYFLCDNMLPENFLFNHKTWFARKMWVLFILLSPIHMYVNFYLEELKTRHKVLRRFRL